MEQKTKHCSQISVEEKLLFLIIEKDANQGHYDEYIEPANVLLNGADNGV